MPETYFVHSLSCRLPAPEEQHRQQDPETRVKSEPASEHVTAMIEPDAIRIGSICTFHV